MTHLFYLRRPVPTQAADDGPLSPDSPGCRVGEAGAFGPQTHLSIAYVLDDDPDEDMDEDEFGDDEEGEDEEDGDDDDEDPDTETWQVSSGEGVP